CNLIQISSLFFFFFFFNDPSPTELYTLSLHDALPISCMRTTPFSSMSSSLILPAPGIIDTSDDSGPIFLTCCSCARRSSSVNLSDRKSTRLNSSHVAISYAVFCLKKKKQNKRVDDE